MSPHLLLPMHVDVCLLDAELAVPRLDQAVFTRPGTLAAGAHVHWALPDCLTRAQASDDGHVRLPAVPDRYLVVRLNPPTAAARTFRAWRVDARTRQVLPLGDWPAEAADDRPWLTAVGLVAGGDLASDVVLDHALFEGAYAPGSLGRFALHDPLDDVPVRRQLAYFVYGWYARPSEDPLFLAGDDARSERQAAQRRARWCHERHLQVTGLDQLLPPPVAQPTPTAGAGGLSAQQHRWVAGLAAVTSGLHLGPNRRRAEPLLFPRHLACHGACFGVGDDVAAPPAVAPRVGLALSLRQAATELAGNEPLVRAALAGVLDLTTSAGMASIEVTDHAADFLAHPGTTAEDARYFRAASPVVTVAGVGRQFRHGEDGRLDPHGKPLGTGQLRVRLGNEVIRVFRAHARRSEVDRPLMTAAGVDMLTGTLPGQPPLALDLPREAALLDPGALARHTAVALATSGQDPALAPWVTAGFHRVLLNLAPEGGPTDAFDAPAPSALSRQQYLALFQPLFAEIEVRLAPEAASEASLRAEWTLAGADFTGPGPAERGLPFVWRCRQPLSASLADLLARKLEVPEAERSDTLVAALTGFDDALATRAALRTGDLTLQQLRIIDLFGRVKDLPSGQRIEQVPPRLTSWARLAFRFAEVGALAGFLRTDFVDHALELFDGTGQALGQLEARGDRVRFVASPLAPVVDPARGPADPRRVIPATCTELLGLVDALHHPAGEVRHGGHTALSALTTVLARARATTRSDHTTAALFGRPVALVRATARLDIRPAGAKNPNQAAELSTKPTGLSLYLGNPRHSAEGVYGFFTGGQLSRLHTHDWPRPAHPFVGADPVVPLTPGTPLALVVLMDPLAALQAATGIQPVKSLTLPNAWIEPALKALRPTLPFGPLLLPGGEPHLPPPHAPGLTWAWVRRRAGEGGALQAEVVPLQAADAQGLRDGATRADEGWLAAAPEGTAWPTDPVKIR